MSKHVNLRPHHIRVFQDRVRYAGQTEIIEGAKEGLKEMYGDNFTQLFFEFINSVNDDTFVTIVDGNDDICDGLKCPFADFCRAGRYDEVNDMQHFKQKLPTSEEVLKISNINNPGYHPSDINSMERYGIEIGKSYRLGDIIK